MREKKYDPITPLGLHKRMDEIIYEKRKGAGRWLLRVQRKARCAPDGSARKFISENGDILQVIHGSFDDDAPVNIPEKNQSQAGQQEQNVTEEIKSGLFRSIDLSSESGREFKSSATEIPVHLTMDEQNNLSVFAFEHRLLKEMELPTDEFTAISVIERNIHVSALDKLSNTVKVLPLNQLLPLLDIAKTTLNRRKGTGFLNVHESERFYQLVYVISLATEYTESYADAIEWLSTPAFALNGQIPFNLIKTSIGTEKLKTLLTQLIYGVVV